MNDPNKNKVCSNCGKLAYGNLCRGCYSDKSSKNVRAFKGRKIVLKKKKKDIHTLIDGVEFR